MSSNKRVILQGNSKIASILVYSIKIVYFTCTKKMKKFFCYFIWNPANLSYQTIDISDSRFLLNVNASLHARLFVSVVQTRIRINKQLYANKLNKTYGRKKKNRFALATTQSHRNTHIRIHSS